MKSFLVSVLRTFTVQYIFLPTGNLSLLQVLLLSLLLPFASCDVDIGCYLRGECTHSNLVWAVYEVSGPEMCSLECEEYGQECRYFTYNQVELHL